MVTGTQDKKIPAGYKQTEVGVIPSDWEVKKLGDIITSIASGKSNTSSEMGDYPIYGSTGIIGYKTYKDYQGDKILIARVGANAGTVRKVLGEYCVSDNTLMITYPADIDIYFSFYQLVNYRLNKLIFGSGQPLITGSQLKDITVPVPPTKAEQTAIAFVLSDADALIEGLTQLIAKKRAIKQGTMQELLTGKRRLPGFTGDWEVKSLYDLAGRRKDRFDDGDWVEAEFLTESGIRLIQTGNIGQGEFIDKESKKYISDDSFNKLGCKELKVGDILICRLAEPAGRACILPDISEERMITAVDVTIFRPLQSVVDRRYLVNIFNTRSWFETVNERCGGSTRTRISRSELGRIAVKVPPFPEQTAIASVLYDMDGEIEALEQRLAKYKQLKQGMTQVLLTGKIRLLTP